MEFEPRQPARCFRPIADVDLELSDCGRLSLAPDEQVTIVGDAGGEYDVVAKEWGYYATPSVNGRLVEQGFKTALVRNSPGRRYVVLVAADRIAAFESYLKEFDYELEEWLDERP